MLNVEEQNCECHAAALKSTGRAYGKGSLGKGTLAMLTEVSMGQHATPSASPPAKGWRAILRQQKRSKETAKGRP